MKGVSATDALKPRDSRGAVAVLGLLVTVLPHDFYPPLKVSARFSLFELRTHLTDLVGRTFTMPT